MRIEDVRIHHGVDAFACNSISQGKLAVGGLGPAIHLKDLELIPRGAPAEHLDRDQLYAAIGRLARRCRVLLERQRSGLDTNVATVSDGIFHQ